MKARTISCLVLSCLWGLATSDFQSSFKNVTRGSDLLLRWEPLKATEYPVVIHARLLNRTTGYDANALEVNVTAGLNTTSFLWESVPRPLPYLETATYEIEVRPQEWAEAQGPVPTLAWSSYFMIAETEDKHTDDRPFTFNGTTIIPSKPTSRPSSRGGIDNGAAIAAGLLVPVVVALAVFGFLWFQRRQKRMLDERGRQREELVID